MPGLDFTIIIIILIFSVILHELAHGYSALMLGDHTAKYAGRLTLNPLKHLDPFGSVIIPLLLHFSATGIIFGWAKPVPYNPYNLRNQRWGEAIVASSGPLTNLLLALIFGLVIRIGMFSGFLSQSFIDMASYVVIINIVLAIFNLVPIPPLDGSKVLFSILPYRFQDLRNILERFGLIILIIFVLVGWQYVFPVIVWLFKIVTGIGISF